MPPLNRDLIELAEKLAATKDIEEQAKVARELEEWARAYAIGMELVVAHFK
jgi:hypothetical protein